MKKTKRTLLLSLAIAGLLLGLAPTTPARPEAAPELALKDLSGTEQKLSDYRGKVVLLNFWATWCVPCRKEMPSLVALQNEYGPKGLQIIAASIDEPSTRPKIEPFARDSKLNFPVLIGAHVGYMEQFGLDAVLPSTVLIDRDGNIVTRITGIIKEDEIKQQLDALLATTSHG